MLFNLISEYKPTGDQPKAIKLLTTGITNGDKAQTLLGVTGSGKTFTIANVIENVQKPTIVISHNKTLAAQLFQEFKGFFPNNKIEYFVSYYDYYQPESYMPSTNVYIAKDLSINAEIEKYRLSTTSSLCSGRRDVIVVSSVSCIYGLGNPDNFESNILLLQQGDKVVQRQLLFKLVDMLFQRTVKNLTRATFRVTGDSVEIFPAYADFVYRIRFWGDEIEEIEVIDPDSGLKISTEKSIYIYPANLFVTNKTDLPDIIKEIQTDLEAQIKFFLSKGLDQEAARIKERTELDLEMIRELGYCSGIENYSRYFDRRRPEQRPFCLLDYFPNDYLLVIDESHVTIPQIRAMYGGDRARKLNLVQYAFRLPSAMDNRPLKFEEFENLINQVIFVSATPAEYEFEKSEGVIIEQIIRPTGLLDPIIEVKPSINQVDDIIEQINLTINNGDRILITTLTKRMAEELSKYLHNFGIKCTYIHSEIKTLERIEIIEKLREGKIDVLIGVNLLREGLDLPEVSLVLILDADKEGFLRNTKSLVQTIGRAARNKNGRVIMYADNMTKSMEYAVEETSRRRMLQIGYNKKHNITPKTISRSKSNEFLQNRNYNESVKTDIQNVADSDTKYLTDKEIDKTIKKLEKQMNEAAKNERFIEAAKLRDEITRMKAKKKGNQIDSL